MGTMVDEGQAALREPVELSRADTRDERNAYGLQLSSPELREVLDALSLHNAVGFLVGALTIPEPLAWDECLDHFSNSELDDDDELDEEDELDEDELDEDDELDEEDELDEDELDEEQSVESERSAHEREKALKELFDHVQQRVAAGAVISLVPIAEDARACDEWIDGFAAAVCQTLHDITDEEAQICLRILPPGERIKPALQEQRKLAARESLASDVTRLIDLWREVPPFDPEQDKQRWSQVVPKRPFEEPREQVIHTGGTFVRSEAKVGRNDLCPCGSGKKYKKCCA